MPSEDLKRVLWGLIRKIQVLKREVTMKKIILIMLLGLSLLGARNNNAVLITGDNPTTAKDMTYFPSLFNGEFLRYEFSESKFTGENNPYNAFWNDTYLMWELMWFYGKFSLYGNEKSSDHIFVLYGEGEDTPVDYDRYTGEFHKYDGWEWPWYITDFPATHEYLDTVVRYLSQGDPNYGYEPMDENDYLYTWTFDHGTASWTLHSFSVSDPSNPVPLDYAFANQISDGLDIDGNFAYNVSYGNYKGFLEITDITNPAQVVERGVLELSDRPRAVDVAGNYAYVVTLGFAANSFIVVDVSDPDHPVKKGSTITTNYLMDVEVIGNKAYTVTRNGALYEVDVSNPSSPYVSHGIPVHKPASDLSIEEENGTRIVYVVSPYAWDYGYLTVVYAEGDWTKEQYEISPTPEAVETDQDYIYITGEGFLKILKRGNLQEVSYLSLSGSRGIDVLKVGDYLYIAGYDGGIYIVDVSSPNSPQLVTHYNPAGYYFTEAVPVGNTVFASGAGPEGNKTYLCLKDYPIRDEDFASKFSTINAGKKVYWMQQCYSGGFIDDLEGSNTVIITASAPDELAWSADDIPWSNITPWQSDPDPEHNWWNYVVEGSENEIVDNEVYYHGEFDYHIMNVIRRVTPTGTGDIAPSGYQDYLISMSEAYDYVNANNSRKYAIIDSEGVYYPPEHPQYSDMGGIGDNLFIGWDDGYPPANPQNLTSSVTAYRPGVVTVNLDWDDNTESDLVAYNVYHRPPEGNWTLLARTKDSHYSYRVRAGTEHYYCVTAYDMLNQESDSSNVIYVLAVAGITEALGGGTTTASVIYREGVKEHRTGLTLDYGDSLVYSMDFRNAEYIVYYTPEKHGDVYMGDEKLERLPVNLSSGLSVYRVNTPSSILKIKGEGEVCMGMIGVLTADIPGVLVNAQGGNTEVNSIKDTTPEVEGIVVDKIFFKGYSGSKHIQIYDIQGRKVMDVNTSGTQINIRGVLMPGVYFVKVNNGKTERITVIR